MAGQKIYVPFGPALAFGSAGGSLVDLYGVNSIELTPDVKSEKVYAARYKNAMYEHVFKEDWKVVLTAGWMSPSLEAYLYGSDIETDTATEYREDEDVVATGAIDLTSATGEVTQGDLKAHVSMLTSAGVWVKLSPAVVPLTPTAEEYHIVEGATPKLTTNASNDGNTIYVQYLVDSDDGQTVNMRSDYTPPLMHITVYASGFELYEGDDAKSIVWDIPRVRLNPPNDGVKADAFTELKLEGSALCDPRGRPFRKSTLQDG